MTLTPLVSRTLGAGMVTLIAGMGVSLSIAPGAHAAAPGTATFTTPVRADINEGKNSNGQNEPQVGVDQTGRTYVFWQSSPKTASHSGGSTTTDGVHFTALADVDPSNPYPNPLGGGSGDTGDEAITTTTWPRPNVDQPVTATGANGLFFSNLGPTMCGSIEIRASTSVDQGKTWAPTDSTCQGAQVDRNWIAAYTPPGFRGAGEATKNTWVYQEYHDFGISTIWLTRSADGGATWTSAQQLPAEEPGSVADQTSVNNSIPGGVAVDKGGSHPGRVYVVWSTSDPAFNAALGGNYSQAEPFDHVFISYSDANGDAGSWHSRAVFNDPCAPNPPQPPNPLPFVPGNTCQDVSELFSPIAVDDAGNVYVAFVWLDVSKPAPEYDMYIEKSTDGGDTFNGGTIDHPGAPVKVNTDTGTHYLPWIAAGANGAVDVAFYATSAVTAPAQFNKPGAAPGTALWYVYMSQSLDGGRTWTQSNVSGRPVMFGDICSTGIFCGVAPSAFGWGEDRTPYDDMGLAIGPDGGARLAWTDLHDSWNATCKPGPTADPTTSSACETSGRRVYFACQTGGMGLEGQAITSCGNLGAATASATPAPSPAASSGGVQLPPTSAGAQVTPGVPLAGLGFAGWMMWRGRRRSRYTKGRT